MSRWRLVRSGVLAAGIVLLAVGPLASAAGAAAGSGAGARDGADYPRITQVEAKRLPQLELTVVVPPVLSGDTLAASAFRVIEGGRPKPVTVATRLPARDLRVMLVVDTTVPAPVLAAEQGAAREFLLGLPAHAQAGVIAGGPEPELVAEPGTDRALAVRALVDLRPQAADDAVDITPSLALALMDPGRGTNVVVAVDSRPTISTVPYETAQAALVSRTAVYSILLAKGAAGYLGGLPELSGGRVLRSSGTKDLVSAYDTVQYELRSRYRIGYRSDILDTHKAELTVTAGGVRAATTFVVTAAAEAPAAPPTGDRARTLLGAALLIFAVGTTLGQRLLRVRSA